MRVNVPLGHELFAHGAMPPDSLPFVPRRADRPTLSLPPAARVGCCVAYRAVQFRLTTVGASRPHMSRARALAVVVGSPRLLQASPVTPMQISLVNALSPGLGVKRVTLQVTGSRRPALARLRPQVIQCYT